MRKLLVRKLLLVFGVLLGCVTLSHAQTSTITGRITDSLGNAVPAATIRIKGSKTASVADNEGKFTIKAAAGQVLVISSSGIATKEVRVTAGVVNLEVRVGYATQNLAEVTVTTALGIKRQARELGYATAQIKAAELNQAAVVNPATGLAAKVSGVDIRLADNGVNPQVKVTFRGNRSISGNNSALIVVDGVPVDQQYLANINPNDIEDVTVLKGSNAAALYGMAASNGVLSISTKRGRGKFSLTYQNKVSFESISYFPAVQNEYGGYGGEGQGAYPFPGSSTPVYYTNPFTGMPNLVPFENEAYGQAYNSLDYHPDSLPVGMNGAQQVIYGPNRSYKNGRKDFFQTGVGDQNELSASMANKWGGLYVSGDHTSKKGTTPNDTYKRDGARINGNLNFGRFTASGGVSYYNVTTDIAGNSYFQNRPVYWNVINQQPNINLKDYKNISLFQNDQGFINAYYPNPWVQVFDSRSKNSTNQLLSNLQLNYKFTNWLTATARGGYSRTWVNAPSYIDSVMFPDWMSAGSGPFGGSNLSQEPGDVGLQKELIKEHFDDFNTDVYLTGTKKYGDFKFNLVVGGNYRVQRSYGNWWSNQVTADPGLIGANVIPSFSTKVTDTSGAAYAVFNYKRFDQSLYSDLTIGYDDWLFLHGSFRNDWTSILSPQSRSFNYPSVDLSAVLSDKIAAIRNSSVISFLKVRAGYAGTGNVSIDEPQPIGVMGNVAGGTNAGGYTTLLPTYGAYKIYPIAGLGSGFPFNGQYGYAQSPQLVQKNLKPEKTAAEEYGFQLGLFKNRINLEVNYYDQKSNNQTLNLQASTASGATSYLTNAGKVDNRGVEIDLSLNPVIKAGDFRFDLTGNFSYQNSKVVAIEGGQQALDQMNFGTVNLGGIYAIAGKSYPQIMTTDWLRDPQGRIIVKASNGLPTVNPNPVDMGNTNYKYFLGLSPSFTYKHWNLRAVFDYRGGAHILNEETNAMDFAGIYAGDAANRQTFIIPNSVIQNGNGFTPNTSVSITPPPGQPSAYWFWADTYSQIGRPYVTSADFWKLREVALTYAFPKSWLGKQAVIKGLDLSLIGRNLIMWRPGTNRMSDPEFSTNAIGNAVGYTTEFQTPPTRVLTASIRATIL